MSLPNNAHAAAADDDLFLFNDDDDDVHARQLQLLAHFGGQEAHATRALHAAVLALLPHAGAIEPTLLIMYMHAVPNGASARWTALRLCDLLGGWAQRFLQLPNAAIPKGLIAELHRATAAIRADPRLTQLFSTLRSEMHVTTIYHNGLALLGFCARLFQRAVYADPDERLPDADALHACDTASVKLYAFANALSALKAQTPKRVILFDSLKMALDASSAAAGGRYTAEGVALAVERWTAAALTPTDPLYEHASKCLPEGKLLWANRTAHALYDSEASAHPKRIAPPQWFNWPTGRSVFARDLIAWVHDWAIIEAMRLKAL